MTTSSQPTTAPASAESPIPAPPVVRSREIPEDDHPDKRPCPSWCWVVVNNPDGYAHEIHEHRITTATHALEEAIDTRASLYPADTDHETRKITTATVESDLRQDGADQPVVRVALRSYPRVKKADGTYGRDHAYAELLRLTIEDAREFAAALVYLADVAEGEPR